MAPTRLPNQNQLYAYYLSRCGHYGVKKPNRHVLALLGEDEPSRLVRLEAEGRERGVSVADLVEMEDGLTGGDEEFSKPPSSFVPLAQRRELRIGDESGAPSTVVVGARGMMAVLDLVATLPLLEVLDLSCVSSWYVGDASAAIAGPGGISGDDVVVRLCEVMKHMPALRAVDITGQPLGCAAAQRLLDVVQANPRLAHLAFSRDGIDRNLYYKLCSAVERNAVAAPLLPAPPPLPASPPAFLLSLPVLDRKTIREQQLLRNMLAEHDNFAGALSAEQLTELVLRARVMSGQEVVSRCGGYGLRGDGAHLFVIKSGVLRAYTDLQGIRLMRGDFFGDNYTNVLLPTCRLEQEERGVVYALPLGHCGALLSAWSTRVSTLYDGFMRKAPLLQPLDTWTRVRLCTCCRELKTFEPGEVVLSPGQSKRCLYMVVGSGAFSALPGSAEDKVITGRYDAYSFERLEIFGVESLVSSRRTSSVSIVAGKDRQLEYTCAILSGAAVRLVQEALWSVLVAAVRPYSLHEDCRQLAKKEPEWVYCI